MATIGAVSPPKREGRAAYLRDLWDRRDFTLHLARGNLVARNAETGLGRWWFVLNPLLMSAVYFLVFGVIISGTDRSSGDFLGYLPLSQLELRNIAMNRSRTLVGAPRETHSASTWQTAGYLSAWLSWDAALSVEIATEGVPRVSLCDLLCGLECQDLSDPLTCPVDVPEPIPGSAQLGYHFEADFGAGAVTIVD